IHPALALVMVGTNDLLGGDVAGYRARLTALAQAALGRGVIPVLSTIPDSYYPELEQSVGPFNQAVADVADALGVPLWNYWKALQGLPHRGLGGDGIHPSTHPLGAGYFAGDGLSYGYNVRNATALEVLDTIERAVFRPEPAVAAPVDLPTTPWAPLPAGTPVV